MSVRPVEDPSMRRLRALLSEEGGLIASLVKDRQGDRLPGGPEGLARLSGSTGPAQLAASGPRVGSQRDEYTLLVETIYEGYLLHYQVPRVLTASEDDLGLLVGDRLYALGLARLVALGDIEGVAELADVITLSALAHGSSQPELADAIWMAGARALGWGGDGNYEDAKAKVREGSPEALEELHAFAKVGPKRDQQEP